ncbi:uncharacterized protein N7483_000593 [Penicillium malachiteum]|uniref:uncharacterized protein n=1 Tax=Penicillium malachiteum TaxID=1324776 RepID=UPI002548DB9A|nr:uncharacterized protein N7483_000593 [Penicillium malachiteum]KAJ5735468.1 hypothetical protein N7483_000593 [Penicillium malachiteum]
MFHISHIIEYGNRDIKEIPQPCQSKENRHSSGDSDTRGATINDKHDMGSNDPLSGSTAPRPRDY